MKVVAQLTKDGKGFMAQLEGCLAFFPEKRIYKLEAGKEYEVKICGYSKSVNALGFPSVLFIDTIRDTEILVEAPILSCSGSMCTTSTYTKVQGTIYPGYNSPVPVVDNVNAAFNQRPYYPQPAIPMWIRRARKGWCTVGVDCYEHIAPVFLKTHETIRRISELEEERHALWQKFINNNTIDGLTLSETMQNFRETHYRYDNGAYYLRHI